MPEWERRTILTVNTTSIPSNRHHVRHADVDAQVRAREPGPCRVQSRPIASLRRFQEPQATWNSRQTGVAPGKRPEAIFGESYASAAVTNVAGAKTSFDLTALVQRAVNGEFERQARLALVDLGGGGDAKESYREYHSSEASSSASRPRLTDPIRNDADGHDHRRPVGRRPPDRAQSGAARGTIRLAAGGTYTGNFRLPTK